jgi:HAE1 family hydrophobic/amphiphilic exporter-1
MGQMMSGGSSYPIDVKIKGDNLEMLKQLAQITENTMEQIAGFSDVHTSFQEGKKEIHIEVDREKAYLLGLTVYEVASMVHTYTLGKTYSRFTREGKEYDIRVILQPEDRRTLRDLKNFPIVTRTGSTVYLGEVARMTEGEGPLRIDREDQVRKISVVSNIQGRDLGSAMAELKEKMAVFEENLPQGYFIEYGGQYEDMQSGFKDLGLALLLAIILVYMIMASQFEHLLHPFVIMFTIPLTIIGVLLALVLTGTTINVVVFMGFIILAGIAVNNGIVMVDYINQLRERGMDSLQAVVTGAVTRLRPVLITALSTIFGMLPMIFNRSEGAGFRVPLGISIVGGLVAATFLTLVVIPIVYCMVNKIKYKELKI